MVQYISAKYIAWFLCFGVGLSLLAPVPARSDVSAEGLPEWNMIRSQLDAKGVTLETTNTTDFGSQVNRRGSPRALVIGDIDLLLTLDAEKLMGWRDATFFLYGLGLYGGSIAAGRQALDSSNITGKNGWSLFEAWYQQNLFQERLSLLAGLYDITSEFDVVRSSSEVFIHDSFGTNPTFALSGKNGPSTFPATGLALRAQAKLTKNLTVRAVVADGVPGRLDDPGGTHFILRGEDGVIVTTEAAYYVGKPDSGQKGQRGALVERPRRLVFRRLGRAGELLYDSKVALGGWLYTTEFEDLSDRDGAGNPLTQDGTYGVYALGEKRVYGEQGTGDQGLWAFGEVAYADPKVNRFAFSIGGGLVYTGLIPGRSLDETGLGFIIARNGEHYKNGQRRIGKGVDGQEVALELTHSIQHFPGITIQPDVQYIINPNTNPENNNALVLLLRLELTMNWFE